MTTPIRTLAELVDAVQALIDSSGKRVSAEDLQDVLNRVEVTPPPRLGTAGLGGTDLDVVATAGGKASVEKRR